MKRCKNCGREVLDDVPHFRLELVSPYEASRVDFYCSEACILDWYLHKEDEEEAED